jgi:AraC-like DNA-binding protein
MVHAAPSGAVVAEGSDMSVWLVTRIISGTRHARTGRLLALLSDEEARGRVQDALGGRMTALSCRSASELVLTVRAHCADCVLVTPWDDSGAPSAPTVRRLRNRFPWLPIAVYCHLEPRSAHQIAALARAGADTIILRGYDDLGRLVRERLAYARSQRTAEVALTALASWQTPESAPILAYCLQHAGDALTVQAVAAALAVDRKTLGNRLAAAALPPPRALIAWCRLLCAARWLEHRERSVEQAALVLRFGSGSALRNMFQRYTGLRPAEVRARGGLACVLSLLTHRLARA